MCARVSENFPNQVLALFFDPLERGRISIIFLAYIVSCATIKFKLPLTIGGPSPRGVPFYLISQYFLLTASACNYRLTQGPGCHPSVIIITRKMYPSTTRPFETQQSVGFNYCLISQLFASFALWNMRLINFLICPPPCHPQTTWWPVINLQKKIIIEQLISHGQPYVNALWAIESFSSSAIWTLLVLIGRHHWPHHTTNICSTGWHAKMRFPFWGILSYDGDRVVQCWRPFLA